MPSQVPTKKRKLSDLNPADAGIIISAMEFFLSLIDENDGDVPPELIPALEKLRTKMEVIPHTSFSKADSSTLLSAGIRHGALFLSEHKNDEIEALGKVDVPGGFLSFDSTIELIKLVRNHVSLVTEAGCRILINIILLRLASTMQTDKSEVNIIPEFPIPKTVFETASGSYSFSGVVDFLLAKVPPKYSRYVLRTPVGALANPDEMGGSLTPTIIEAKRDNLPAALPQAAVAVASYCKQHRLSFLRGCITSGEQWMFFVYQSDATGGKISHAEEISLGTGLEKLPIILGLLKDLIENACVADQKYFEY